MNGKNRDNQCPICSLVPPNHIFQCKEGHPICSECLLNTQDHARRNNHAPECNFCTASLNPNGVSRCRVLENMLDQLTFDCYYSKLGCPMKLKRGDIKDHEDSCLHGTRLELCKLFGENCDFILTMGHVHATEKHLSSEHPSRFHEHYAAFKWSENLPMNSIIAQLPLRQEKIMILCRTDGDQVSFSCIDAFLCIPEKDKVEVEFHILNEADPSLNLHWTLLLSPGLISWKYFKNPQLEIGKRTLQRLCDQEGNVEINVSVNDKSRLMQRFPKPSCFQRRFPKSTQPSGRNNRKVLPFMMLLLIFVITVGFILSFTKLDEERLRFRR